VGRKVLAGLRTVWLVEERSLQKNKQQKLLRRRQRRSKYRLIQLLYDAAFVSGRFLATIWKTLTGRGGGELKEFFAGLWKWDLSSEEESVEARVGAALGACVAVNLSGALFSLSPVILTVLAMGVGLLWPTWHSELADSIGLFWEDRRARGRGEDPALLSTKSALSAKSSSWSGWSWTVPKIPSLARRTEDTRTRRRATGPVDKKRYHYYRKVNGKKVYYRVGTPSKFRNFWQFGKPQEQPRRSWWI
jgi:hypothetical protein